MWEIWWQDFGITPDFLSSLQYYQRCNHFLGMYNIARKNTLAMHLRRFLKEFPDHYNFFPKTWIYPADSHEIAEYNSKKYRKRNEEIAQGIMTQEESDADPPVMFIVKPEAGCQGKGIFIARKYEEMQQKVDRKFTQRKKEFEEQLKQQENYDTQVRYADPNMTNTDQVGSGFSIPDNTYVVQKYLKAPALWNQHKFDFRIYVLLLSVVDPMQIFIYKDGLVRLASEKWTGLKNINDTFSHLTNYSLNKKNTGFNDDEHKLKLSDCLKGQMTQPPTKKNKPPASRSAEQIWADIDSIVIKTIITVQPHLSHIYKSCQSKEPDCCFELLGFDIILDQKLKPWMLEVNHTPSFNSDTHTDHVVKDQLIKDCLEIIQLSIDQRKRVQWDIKNEMRQQMQQNIFKRISAKEHSERVRFDPALVEKKLPKNGFRLVYPKQAPGEDPDLYIKMTKRADDLWKQQTGTITSLRPDQIPPKKKKKKKKPRKKKTVRTEKQQQDAQEESQSESEDDNESNWRENDANIEEIQVQNHLMELAQKSHMMEHKSQILEQTQILEQKTLDQQKSRPKVQTTPLRNQSSMAKEQSAMCQCRETNSQSARKTVYNPNQIQTGQPMMISQMGVHNTIEKKAQDKCEICNKKKRYSYSSSSRYSKPRETLKLAQVGSVSNNRQVRDFFKNDQTTPVKDLSNLPMNAQTFNKVQMMAQQIAKQNGDQTLYQIITQKMLQQTYYESQLRKIQNVRSDQTQANFIHRMHRIMENQKIIQRGEQEIKPQQIYQRSDNTLNKIIENRQGQIKSADNFSKPAPRLERTNVNFLVPALLSNNAQDTKKTFDQGRSSIQENHRSLHPRNRPNDTKPSDEQNLSKKKSEKKIVLAPQSTLYNSSSVAQQAIAALNKQPLLKNLNHSMDNTLKDLKEFESKLLEKQNMIKQSSVRKLQVLLHGNVRR